MKERVYCTLSISTAAKGLQDRGKTGEIKDAKRVTTKTKRGITRANWAIPGGKRATTRAKLESSRMRDKLNACSVVYAL